MSITTTNFCSSSPILCQFSFSIHFVYFFGVHVNHSFSYTDDDVNVFSALNFYTSKRCLRKWRGYLKRQSGLFLRLLLVVVVVIVTAVVAVVVVVVVIIGCCCRYCCYHYHHVTLFRLLLLFLVLAVVVMFAISIVKCLFC